jgi:hypothetical protein
LHPLSEEYLSPPRGSIKAYGAGQKQPNDKCLLLVPYALCLRPYAIYILTPLGRI